MTSDTTALEPARATTERFRRAVERGDTDGFLATLHPDVVLRSPITMQVEFHGHDELRRLMGAVFATIEDISYFEDIGDHVTRALFYRAHVGSQAVEEATLVRLDGEARVTEITLWFRPLPGLTAVMAGLGPRLARRDNQARARLVAAMTRPLAVLTRVGDRAAVKLVKP